MLDRKIEYTRMRDAEGRLWWYRCLHRLVLDGLKLTRTPRDAAILDAGCGTAGLLAVLRGAGYVNLTGFDLSGDAIGFCKQRGFQVEQGDIRRTEELYSPGSFDAIISNDVLSCLSPEEVAPAIDGLCLLLRSRGVLIVNLPAFKIFSGLHDLSVGTTVRFQPESIPRLFNPDRFEVLRRTYWPFLLSPLIALWRRRQRAALVRDRPLALRSDVGVPARPINVALYALTRLEHMLIPSGPFGSSLFLVLRKKDRITSKSRGMSGGPC